MPKNLFIQMTIQTLPDSKVNIICAEQKKLLIAQCIQEQEQERQKYSLDMMSNLCNYRRNEFYLSDRLLQS